MGYNPSVSHLEVGYNPFTYHLLTSWGIQVVGGFNPFETYVRQIGSWNPKVRGWRGENSKKSLSCHPLKFWFGIIWFHPPSCFFSHHQDSYILALKTNTSPQNWWKTWNVLLKWYLFRGHLRSFSGRCIFKWPGTLNLNLRTQCGWCCLVREHLPGEKKNVHNDVWYCLQILVPTPLKKIVNWIISPNRDEHKKIFETTTQCIPVWYCFQICCCPEFMSKVSSTTFWNTPQAAFYKRRC